MQKEICPEERQLPVSQAVCSLLLEAEGVRDCLCLCGMGVAGTWSPAALGSNGTDLRDVEHWGLSTDIHGHPRVCISQERNSHTFRFLQVTHIMYV